jgi:hypothetical protein
MPSEMFCSFILLNIGFCLINGSLIKDIKNRIANYKNLESRQKENLYALFDEIFSHMNDRQDTGKIFNDALYDPVLRVNRPLEYKKRIIYTLWLMMI